VIAAESPNGIVKVIGIVEIEVVTGSWHEIIRDVDALALGLAHKGFDVVEAKPVVVPKQQQHGEGNSASPAAATAVVREAVNVLLNGALGEDGRGDGSSFVALVDEWPEERREGVLAASRRRRDVVKVLGDETRLESVPTRVEATV